MAQKNSTPKTEVPKLKRLKGSGKYYQVWLLFSVLVAGIAGYFLYSSFAAPPPPTIYLSPASQTYGANATFTVQVRENSSSTGVNAVQANFSYPANLVDFVSISSAGAAFGTEAPSSGGNGLVSIARGVACDASCPSLTGDQLVATVTFKTKAASGTASMAFTSGTALVSTSDNENLLSSLSSTGGASFVVDNTGPSISVSAPTNGAALSAGGNVAVTASASDSGSGVASVEFYIDGVKVSTLTSAPYNYTWNTAGYALGSHAIEAKAFDGVGNTKTSTTNTVTLADQTPPTVSITAPSAGTKISGTTSITASASDGAGGSGISKVEFYIDGALKGTDSTSPYSYSWNSTATTDGVRSLSAKAYDNASIPNVATSAAISVTVDNTAPTTPGNFRTTSTGTNLVALAWNASTDTSGVSSYRLSRNGNLLTTVSGTSYTDSTSAPGTAYTYTLVAVDNSGNLSAAASLSVTTPAPKIGDINGDNVVGITDLAMLLNKWDTNTASCDLNNNGTVDIFDLAMLLNKWGS